MAFVVIYDACVLFPAPLRDFLLRLARTGIVQAKWSDEILDECFDAILRERPDLTKILDSLGLASSPPLRRARAPDPQLAFDRVLSVA